MSDDLLSHVGDYLQLRRSLGYKLQRDGVVLPQFVKHLVAAGTTTITTELAIAWAQLPEGSSAKLCRDRLIVVRGFAKYMTTIDAATQVPPADVFGFRANRPAPYLWSQVDIDRLLEAAGRLRSPFRAATYEAFLGLLAVAGLRNGEARDLQRSDVDLDAGLITIN